MPDLRHVQYAPNEAFRAATHKKTLLELAAVVLALPLLCWAGKSLAAGSEKAPPKDITNAEFTRRSANCGEYEGSYVSSVKDVKRDIPFKGSLAITKDKYGNKCVFKSNSIPNHNFNDGSETFVNPVKAVIETHEVPAEPHLASKTTDLSTSYDNAILLNGVKVDLLSAACYCVGDEPLGQEKIGCLTMEWGWRYDPMSKNNKFGADSHNAHAQPDGAYHYHGNPRALFKGVDFAQVPRQESPVIGFAADGFPIYGPYIEDGKGGIRAVKSGYKLKKGGKEEREHLEKKESENERCYPGGTYDGRFREDYEYDQKNGDLDKCNGMTYKGQYGYYVTKDYPYVIGCFAGIPDSSFKKATEDAVHTH